jgi:predicted O-methyltransferase YrrM
MIDPFLGIGSSALAASECDIEKFIGFDIDGDYLKTARELLKEAAATATQEELRSVQADTQHRVHVTNTALKSFAH